MSSGTEVLILPAVALGGVFIAGAVVVGVAGGVAYGTGKAAYAAAQHLEHEYQQSLAAFRARVEAERADLVVSSRAHESSMSAALASAARTKVRATENANTAFLTKGIERLLTRLSGLPDAGPQLPQECAQLQQAMLRDPVAFQSHLATYETLSEAVAQLASRHRARLMATRFSAVELRTELEQELMALSVDVEETLLDDTNAASLHADLLKRLGEVRHLIALQPLSAEQGLKMLRSRTRRDLANYALQRDKRERLEAQHEAQQEERAMRLRELAAHAGARLQAVSQVALSPDVADVPACRIVLSKAQEESETMLRRLAQMLSGDLPDNLSPLQKLCAQADTLFGHTQKDLEEVALQHYLQSQVADVLSEMGYHVTSVPSQKEETSDTPTLMTSLSGSADLGVQLQIDKSGNLVSEMVAFSTEAAEVDLKAQEKVCALMDEVFDALQGRGCTVREKKRRHLKKGQHHLRVAERHKTTGQASATRPLAAPMAKRVDGSL